MPASSFPVVSPVSRVHHRTQGCGEVFLDTRQGARHSKCSLAKSENSSPKIKMFTRQVRKQLAQNQNVLVAKSENNSPKITSLGMMDVRDLAGKLYPLEGM
jgi:hypothetical protein